MQIMFYREELSALNKSRELILELANTVGINTVGANVEKLLNLDLANLKPGVTSYGENKMYIEVTEYGQLIITINRDYVVERLNIQNEYLTGIKNPLKSMLLASMQLVETGKSLKEERERKIEELNLKYKKKEEEVSQTNCGYEEYVGDDNDGYGYKTCVDTTDEYENIDKQLKELNRKMNELINRRIGKK
jgi:hypothetical protein